MERDTARGWWLLGGAFLVIISAGWFAVENKDASLFDGPVLALLGAVYLAPLVALCLFVAGLVVLGRTWPPEEGADFSYVRSGLSGLAIGLPLAFVGAAAVNGLVVVGAVLVAFGAVLLLVAARQHFRTDGPTHRPAFLAVLLAVTAVSVLPMLDGVSAISAPLTADVPYQTTQEGLFGGYEWSTRPAECGSLVDRADGLLHGSDLGGDEASACAGRYGVQGFRVAFELIVAGTVLMTALLLLVLDLRERARARTRPKVMPWRRRRPGGRHRTQRSSRHSPATG